MVVKRTETIFDNTSGTKQYKLDSFNACQEIAISVKSGSLSVSGIMNKGDNSVQNFGLINLLTGEITDAATPGAYSILGGETLYEVIFTASGNTVATAKFIY